MSKGKKPAPADSVEEKEPFLLSILPFAGLGLLLAIVLLLRATGGGGGGGDAEAAPDIEEEVSRMAVERWERESVQDLGLSEKDFALGPEDAAVTIVEFSDFQCPYCRTSNVKTKEAFENFPGDVRLVFKNYPLDTSCNDGIEQQLHPVACRAAVFARCAGRESPERFWEVHDAMFDRPQVNATLLDAFAGELGLDSPEFDQCVEQNEELGNVRNDINVGLKLRIRGTPAIYVNGRKLADYRGTSLEEVVKHILAGNSVDGDTQ